VEEDETPARALGRVFFVEAALGALAWLLLPRERVVSAVSMPRVEVLLASAVLAVLALGLVGLFGLGGRSSVASEREGRALWLAHRALERLRAEADWRAQVTAGSLEGFQLVPGLPEGFQAELLTEAVGEDLDVATVRIRWREGLQGRELELAALLSRRGAESSWARTRADEEPAYPGEETP